MRDGWKRGTSLVSISKCFMLCIEHVSSRPPSPPPLLLSCIHVAVVFLLLSFFDSSNSIIVLTPSEISVEYVMVKTKFQQEVTLPTLQYV